MYNVKVTKYLHDMEVIIYDRPIHKHEKDINTCVIEKDGFGYEIDKKDLYLSEDIKERTKKELIEKYMNAYHSLIVSRNRTKQKIYNYARANKWEWFFTFTFNPEKVDSFDYDEITVVMSEWLNCMFHNNKTGRLKYLIVPEQHKSGRWHFHGIFSNLDYDLWKLTFSGKYEHSEPIYNVNSFTYGWTTATQVYNTKAVSHYICKYITKSMLDNLKNKKRYWASRSCSCGESETYFIHKNDIETLINSFGEPDYIKSVSTPYNDVTYIQIDDITGF